MKESNEYRSRVMRAVKSENTSCEVTVRKLLYKLGFRYRLHDHLLPGHPDIVFRKKKKVIFVHGCFWHGHACKRGDRLPKTNNQYWHNKISKNKIRDQSNLSLLVAQDWSVLIIWECQLKQVQVLTRTLLEYLNR